MKAPHQTFVTDADGTPVWEDKPFYTEVKTVALATDASVEITDNWSASPAFPVVADFKNIFDGAEATVTIDGIEYKCSWVDCSAVLYWEGWFCLGNLAIASEDLVAAGYADTGEPFAVEYRPSSGDLWLYHATDGTYTVSVASEVEQFHTLDPKYIPSASGDGWDAVIRVSEEDKSMNLPTDAAMYTLEGMTVKEIREAVIAGNMPRVCVYKPFFYGEDSAITHIVETIWAGREGGYTPTRVEFFFNDVYMDAKVRIRATEADGITYVEKKEYTLT